MNNENNPSLSKTAWETPNTAQCGETSGPEPETQPPPTDQDSYYDFSLIAGPPASATPSSEVPVADNPDPQTCAAFQAQSESAPPSLRARRIEIKARCGSFLRKLSRPQRDQLFLWLTQYSVPKVANLVAQPPPAGFGLQVQHTTLRRIRATMATSVAEDNYENSALAADTLAEIIDQNRVDFAPVIGNLLLQKTFDLARGDSASSADLKEIIASFVKLQELELKTRRLQIESSRAHRVGGPQTHKVDLNIIPPARPPTPVSPPPAIQFAVLPRSHAAKAPQTPETVDPDQTEPAANHPAAPEETDKA